MILERAGRAVRNPARDAMLSHATKEMGRGKGFGLHEALDQIGATTGPLIIAGVLLLGVSLRRAFGFLLVPAVAALVILAFARFRYPHPETFETTRKEQLGVAKFPASFWLYLAASSLVAIGFVDYPLIAYHLQKSDLVKDSTIAIYYSVAMGIDALAALIFGRLYDKKGIWVLVVSTLIALPFPLFAFSRSPFFPLIGILLWGIGMGAQESVMRAAIADFAARDKRATAYGFFNAVYGTFWFAGSAVFGLVYDLSIAAAVVFSLVPQILSIPFFILSAMRRSADAAGRTE